MRSLLSLSWVVLALAGVPAGEALAQFTRPPQGNPAGQPLNVEGIEQPQYYSYIYYGMFDRMRQEDSGRARFAWIFHEFIAQIGKKHPQVLKGPLTRLEWTTQITRHGITSSRTETYTMEERVVARFRQNENDRSGIFGPFHREVETLLSRHAPPSPVIMQFYENLVRYALNEPSVQVSPPTAGSAAGTANKSAPAGKAINKK